MLLSLVLGLGQVRAAEPVALAGRTMGTTWAAKWIQPTPALDPTVVEQHITVRLAQLEHQFSTYRADSELSRFNRAPTPGWMAVSPELAVIAARAREISALTEGAFDVTVAPLLQLWGFGPQTTRGNWPTDAELAAARAAVGWRKLEIRLDPPALRKSAPELTVDFSSIAKGFAVDELSHQLARLGAGNHLVQIGGDMKAAGLGADGTGWRVAIEEPRENSRTLARVVSLVDSALSTSGNYRNRLTLAGRPVGHLIDPRTGQPAADGLAAVSVRHASCATSSALATGLFVLGPEAGLALATRENLAALFFLRGDTAAAPQRETPAFAAPAAPATAQIR